jgi:aldehyde:ferredoxin oxidoreductase
MKLGERRINMFRAFNVREGFRAVDDVLPERMFEPLESGPRAGHRVSEGDLSRALRLYYEMMNWDREGIPREAKLIELSVPWANDLIAGCRHCP